MITKTQWHKFCQDIDRALYQYPEWNKTITFKGEEIDYVRDDVIYCKPARGVPVRSYIWPFNTEYEEWLDMSRMRRTVFRHPQSIPEERRFKDLYNDIEVHGKLDFKNMRK